MDTSTTSDARVTPKSRTTARWLSLGGTLGSVAIAGIGGAVLKLSIRAHNVTGEHTGDVLIGIGAAGSLFAPTLGDWYAGDPMLTTGVKLRAAGIGVGRVVEERADRDGDGCGGRVVGLIRRTQQTVVGATAQEVRGHAETSADPIGSRFAITSSWPRCTAIDEGAAAWRL